MPFAAAPTLVPLNDTWLPSARTYHGLFFCHSKNPPVSRRSVPSVKFDQLPGGCGAGSGASGNVAVKRLLPLPLYGE